jgi:hypothetical protein
VALTHIQPVSPNHRLKAIEVEGNYGLKPRHLAEALKLVEEHADRSVARWPSAATRLWWECC